VFASANTGYPEELAAEGLVEEPVVFARNRLVIAVAPGSPVHSIEDLARPGLDLVICAGGVPCGDYARQVLARLPEAARAFVNGLLDGRGRMALAEAGFLPPPR
jgi:molybdate transport system substrate-binding protein